MEIGFSRLQLSPSAARGSVATELRGLSGRDPALACLSALSQDYFVLLFLFLQTNSKAFTAKTSCVRRRYREFVWLRRQLQKNAGLV